MTSLFKRSALASAFLLTAMGAQAESISSETSDSDTIVVGVMSEKVNLRVTGYKNLAVIASAPAKTVLGEFIVSTSSGIGKLAITYSPEHKPKKEGSELTGEIKSDSGYAINTYINSPTSNTGATYPDVNGTIWFVPNSNDTSYKGFIYTYGVNKLSAGIYPITLRAALYQP